MEAQKPTFEQFLIDVDPSQLPYVMQIHTFLTDNGCKIKIELAKNGYVVSYTVVKVKKVIANFIFRKNGLLIRIYADNVSNYNNMLHAFPAEMQDAMVKASNCKRLLDPTKCSSRCPMGNVFSLRGETQKKCRYSSFVFLLSEQNTPFVQSFLENELRERSA